MPKLDNHIKPLNKQTIQESIYERLCSLIYEGHLVPGETMTVVKLSEAFGVSSMPVREALARLTASGAIDVISGRSVGIPNLSLEKLDDITKVRLEIEPLALLWSFENRTKKFEDKILSILNKMKEAEKSDKVQDYIEANYNFHLSLYQNSQSETLVSIIKRIWLQVSPYFHWLKQTDSYKLSNVYHENMYKNIIDGNIDKACDYLRKDIKQAYTELQIHLKKR